MCRSEERDGKGGRVIGLERNRSVEFRIGR